MRISFNRWGIMLVLLLAPHASAIGQELPTTMEQKIQYLSKLDNTEPHLRSLYEQDQLGAFYNNLVEEDKWLTKLQDTLGPSEVIARAKQRLRECQVSVVQFYQHSINVDFIGDRQSYQQPNMIVVLGAREQWLTKRVELALQLAKRFPSIPLILSGKGKGEISEAQQMETFLLNQNIPNTRLTKEEDSMDTIGNAIFTRLTLIRQGFVLPQRILVVTSAFHAPRALFFFRQVFGPNTPIAVALEHNTSDLPLLSLSDRINTELMGLALTANTILSLSMGLDAQGNLRKVMLTGDVCSQFYQLLMYNPQYSNHKAILSHFHGICVPPHYHSTVTLFAKLRGLSTSVPRTSATW